MSQNSRFQNSQPVQSAQSRQYVQGGGQYVAARPAQQEDVISSHTVQIERKEYTFELRENPKGQFVKVIEVHGERRHSVCIPITGMEEFMQGLNAVLQGPVS